MTNIIMRHCASAVRGMRWLGSTPWPQLVVGGGGGLSLAPGTGSGFVGFAVNGLSGGVPIICCPTTSDAVRVYPLRRWQPYNLSLPFGILRRRSPCIASAPLFYFTGLVPLDVAASHPGAILPAASVPEPYCHAKTRLTA